MKPVVSNRKRSLVMGLKSLGMVVVLGIFLAACSSAPPTEELEAEAVKKALPHYPLDGRIHWLDPELYWELQKILIQMGADPSPENVDELYHHR